VRRANVTGCPPCSYQSPRLRRLWRLGCAAPAPQLTEQRGRTQPSTASLAWLLQQSILKSHGLIRERLNATKACSAREPRSRGGVHNAVGVHDRGQPVRNDEHGVLAHEPVQRVLHDCLAVRVQRARRLHNVGLGHTHRSSVRANTCMTVAGAQRRNGRGGSMRSGQRRAQGASKHGRRPAVQAQ